MSALIVIDYQGCFLPGGGLATNTGNSPVTADKDGRRMANEIDALIKTNKFSTVYFTKDMHHPDNVSINDKAPFTANSTFYKNAKMIRKRDWVKEDDRLMQKKWPRHCTIPPMNPFYSKLVSVKNLQGKANTNVTKANMIGSKINEFSANGSKHYGAELPFALEVYEKGKPSGVTSDIVEVYKGFDINVDSYSAVADAVGDFKPFVAKENGEFKDPDGTLEPFMDRLMKSGLTDIYLTGIARDVCVYWTAMDILNFWIFAEVKNGNTKVPKVHFLYNLTRPVGSVAPGVVLDISKEELMKNVSELYTKVTGKTDGLEAYFSVEDSTMSGGRVRSGKHCNCKKCSSTRRVKRKLVRTRRMRK